MSKKQWRNLYRSYPSMVAYVGVSQTLAWIAYYSRRDAEVVRRVITPTLIVKNQLLADLNRK